MIRFRHRSCTNEVIRYIGAAALTPGTVMRQRDWTLPNGEESPERILDCPDCKKRVLIDARTLVEINDSLP